MQSIGICWSVDVCCLMFQPLEEPVLQQIEWKHMDLLIFVSQHGNLFLNWAPLGLGSRIFGLSFRGSEKPLSLAIAMRSLITLCAAGLVFACAYRGDSVEEKLGKLEVEAWG